MELTFFQETLRDSPGMGVKFTFDYGIGTGKEEKFTGADGEIPLCPLLWEGKHQ